MSYHGLPSFKGNRFENKIEVGSTSSLGGEGQLGIINPLGSAWQLNGGLIFALHPLIISSPESGGKPLSWFRGLLRLERYFTEKQSFFGQLSYDGWTQKWQESSSSVSGMNISLGMKYGF